jgi:serine/threonine protein kinase
VRRAQLRGRHVAKVKDVDVTSDGLPYMVMDFLEGHDLEIEIERRGRLPIPEAIDYVLQACAAMVEAHQLGIIHRDLKPSNLFLERDVDGTSSDQGWIVKVLDFGISKVAANEGDAKLTEVDAIMGTALYMSPEQVKASHAVDARADIWALGVILYEALAGRVPWMGAPPQVAALIVTEDPPDLRSLCQVPDELANIVHKTGDTADGPRTLVEAPGVSEDLMRSHEAGTAPGWSGRPSGGHGRAAWIGMLVALAVGTITLGAILLFVKRPRVVMPSMSDTKPAPVVSATPIARTPIEPASSVVATSATPTTMSPPAQKLAMPQSNASAPTRAPGASATRTGTPRATPPPAPKPTSSAADRPLFLRKQIRRAERRARRLQHQNDQNSRREAMNVLQSSVCGIELLTPSRMRVVTVVSVASCQRCERRSSKPVPS